MIKDYVLGELTQIISTLYAIKAHFARLSGYLDHNYLLTCLSPSSQTKNVLKISNSNEQQSLLKIQNYVLRHLKSHKLLPLCSTPELELTLEGEDMAVFSSKGLKNFVRIFNFIQGKQMWDFEKLPDYILGEVGELTAELSLQLECLTQQQQIQSLINQSDFNSYEMNIMTFRRVYEQKKQYLNQDITQIIQQVKLHFEEVEHIVHGIPHQVIHNDVCFSNILINQTPNNEAYVCGLIDFSSLCYGPRIIELVMPCARMNLDKSEPLKNMLLIIKAFKKLRALTKQQKIVLYPLIKMRLAFLCLFSCEKLALNKESEYLQRCKDGHVHYLKVISKACTNEQFLQKLNSL